MAVCVIPARGGSKRIERKNIRLFCGEPMMAYSIKAAHESGCFERVIVSTDDEEIAAVARDYGAHVPFMRPSDLADDFATTAAVMAHAVAHLDEDIPHICCLYATAPFVCPKDLQAGWALLRRREDADYAFAATTFAFPIQRALSRAEDGTVRMFVPENYAVRSQDLPEAWHDAGQFYWGRRKAWLSQTPIFNSVALAVALPRYRVQDIDTQEDWQRAQWLWRALQAASEE